MVAPGSENGETRGKPEASGFWRETDWDHTATGGQRWIPRRVRVEGAIEVKRIGGVGVGVGGGGGEGEEGEVKV